MRREARQSWFLDASCRRARRRTTHSGGAAAEVVASSTWRSRISFIVTVTRPFSALSFPSSWPNLPSIFSIDAASLASNAASLAPPPPAAGGRLTPALLRPSSDQTEDASSSALASLTLTVQLVIKFCSTTTESYGPGRRGTRAGRRRSKETRQRRHCQSSDGLARRLNETRSCQGRIGHPAGMDTRMFSSAARSSTSMRGAAREEYLTPCCPVALTTESHAPRPSETCLTMDPTADALAGRPFRGLSRLDAQGLRHRA